MFAGIAVWVAGLLVLFYLPAGVRIGQGHGFEVILGALGLVGAGLLGTGWWMRRE